MTEVNSGPVFIVGSMGSGTTLVRLILDSHPNIAIAQETGVARALVANEWIPFWEHGGEWYGRLGWTLDELEAHMRESYGVLFSRFAQQRGATRWGDKTPFHIWHMPLLARVFPDAVFVGTTRHPAAVAASIRKRFGYSWSGSAQHWVRWNKEMIYQGAQLGERFSLLRYEDLVTQPEEVTRDLMSWLGEPWSDRLLSFHEVHMQRGTPSEVEGLTRSDSPIDATRAARWAIDVDHRTEQLLLRRTSRLAQLLGYDQTAPLPARPLTSTARLVATGTDMAELVRAPSAVKWHKRPMPPLENRPLMKQDLRALKQAARRGSRKPGHRLAAAGARLRRGRLLAGRFGKPVKRRG